MTTEVTLNPVIKEFQLGGKKVTLETGRIAKQSTGAVLISTEGTVVLCTVVGNKSARSGQDFFPLTVNYQEKTYAAGKIPGGFFKREGRPTEKETLTSRLIDRPVRPLFPKGFKNEVQVIATVISLNTEVNPDIPALIGASAALAISGMPFKGPIGAARVAYIDGNYVLNPSTIQLADSNLDLIVAGTENAVLMVESEADCLSEEVMLGAVVFGHEQMQVAITAIKELAAEAGKPAWDYAEPAQNPALTSAVEAQAIDRAHRIGQDKKVFAYRFVAQNSIEERIADLQESKRKLADAIVSADDSLIRDLTKEDLEVLFS